ncbi:MAG TPA: amino acid adenylation domain-containing protein [Ktedonosporobacter sp.]|jgi:amino acid adenylation domain-containing protein|nr:amino acid adenylation domain-containing protein [Ktedonosporobacter sp.]
MVTKEATAKQHSAFSATKRALLEKRLRGDSALALIPKRPDAEFAPTTFSQQRLWFLDQLEPGTATYNIPIAMRIRGPLDSTILEQCLNELVRRHETWRTTFESRDGIPVQHIGQPHPIELSELDLASLPESNREHEAIRLATEYAQMPFDLATGPLVRVLLLRLNDGRGSSHDEAGNYRLPRAGASPAPTSPEEDFLFVLVQHHSISDGWSIGIILQEIAVLYEAFQAQKPSPLPELAVQYADYACWQQQKLQGKELERQLAYWQQQLEDAPGPLDLPGRGIHQDLRAARGETHHFHFSRALSDQLRALCQQEGVTLFMLILAALQVVLHRYTDQDDLMISTSTANRTLPELEPIVGFFVNTLVLRTSLAGDPAFEELLKRVQNVSLAAFAHQEVPFERAVARVPALQVHFILQNTPSQSKELSAITVERIELENNTAKFDLFLNVEDASEIFGFFEFNADLFDTATIQRLHIHFQRVLEAAVQHPEMQLSSFALLTEEECQQILFEWNNTVCRDQHCGCIHELFEAQAARTPQQAALESEGVILTYEELNRKANQVAHYLRSLGVAPEVPVGLCLERSIEQMVAVLGILKAGGAYLPLDPSYPAERLEWMLADAQAPILLTQSSLLPRLPSHDCTVVCLDTSQDVLSEMATTNPPLLATEANMAYIIYTSGSTGQPKGVMIAHRSVVNHSQAIARQYHIESSDRMLQFASLSFDAAGEELYPTWLNGATLVLRPEQLPTSITALHDFIRKERLTILNLPTTYWHQWVTQLVAVDVAMPTPLRLVIVGGESVQPAHYRQWLDRAGTQIQWSNTYGPTETTITAILHAPAEATDLSVETTPIGRPIANMQAYVLDRRLQPVPIGATGEIYLGGVGLARGYLNRPDLTADHFIPNPYGPAGTRLYRTGDLARYLSDGNMLYVGRSDQQVKIRGYRIELGEIENVLLQHPAIAESAVLAQEDASGDKYLVAYIVSNQAILTASELRQFLSHHLPEYMLPASYMFLEQFPVNSSGKINRRALPVPTRDRHDSAEAYVSPRTPLEEVLACVWSDVLHIERVGIYDNFFEIGGHSLRATQLVARLQDIFPVDLPLKHIFEHPTIASLAEALLQDEGQREMISMTAELFLMVTDLSDEKVEALLKE